MQQEYEKGCIRLMDPQNQRVIAFLKACGRPKFERHDYYPRKSSHYPELTTEDGHFGLDINEIDAALPAGMRHICFARLSDGTSYVKMETKGCALSAIFSTNKIYRHFSKLKALREGIHHGFNYLLSLLPFSGRRGAKHYPSRREKDMIDLIKPSFTKFMKISGVKDKEIKKALKEGLKAMDEAADYAFARMMKKKENPGQGRQ